MFFFFLSYTCWHTMNLLLFILNIIYILPYFLLKCWEWRDGETAVTVHQIRWIQSNCSFKWRLISSSNEQVCHVQSAICSLTLPLVMNSISSPLHYHFKVENNKFEHLTISKLHHSILEKSIFPNSKIIILIIIRRYSQFSTSK